MKKNYGIITFLNQPMTLVGNLIKVETTAPDFKALSTDLKEVNLHDFEGSIKVISSVPSIDTGICDLQTRRFNQEAAKVKNVVFLSISCDLPFALHRYCGTAGIENIQMLSDHRMTDFGLNYGFLVEELRLLTRGIIILDKQNVVKYVEIVKEVAGHPNYDKALAQLQKVINE